MGEVNRVRDPALKREVSDSPALVAMSAHDMAGTHDLMNRHLRTFAWFISLQQK
jgi:hypothetical protein